MEPFRAAYLRRRQERVLQAPALRGEEQDIRVAPMIAEIDLDRKMGSEPGPATKLT